MRKLKVWGGATFKNGAQVRTIVATYTKKKACELIGTTMGDLNTYWSETRNDTELKTALAKPETVFIASGIMEKDFTAEAPDKEGENGQK